MRWSASGWASIPFNLLTPASLPDADGEAAQAPVPGRVERELPALEEEEQPTISFIALGGLFKPNPGRDDSWPICSRYHTLP